MSDDNVRHEERPIMKKAIALLVAAMLLTGLSACGGSTTADAPAKSDGTSKTETNKEEPKPQPADLTGTWKQTNSNDPSSYMEATISGDTIEVNWIGTDTKSLYWKGTYQAPAAAGDWKWTSQGDTETMASALLASQDATKDFTYSEADGVSWETTALGTTITVKTVKQSIPCRADQALNTKPPRSLCERRSDSVPG